MYTICNKKYRLPCLSKTKGAFISLMSLGSGKSLTLCMCMYSFARATYAEIMRRRDAQCNIEELPYSLLSLDIPKYFTPPSHALRIPKLLTASFWDFFFLLQASGILIWLPATFTMKKILHFPRSSPYRASNWLTQLHAFMTKHLVTSKNFLLCLKFATSFWLN